MISFFICALLLLGVAATSFFDTGHLMELYADPIDGSGTEENGDNAVETDVEEDEEEDEEEEDDTLQIEGGVLKSVDYGVTKLVLPDTVKRIGARSIPDWVTSISIPASVTKIDRTAFANATSIKTITVAKKNANFTVFKNCLYDKKKTTLLLVPAKAKTVSLYSKTKIIASYAFNSCARLKSVTLPKSVTTIKANAFMNCDKLTKLTIYSKANAISINAFSGINVSYTKYNYGGQASSTKGFLKIYCKSGSKADKVAKKKGILVKYI